jgi:hypothetical protein
MSYAALMVYVEPDETPEGRVRLAAVPARCSKSYVPEQPLACSPQVRSMRPHNWQYDHVVLDCMDAFD